MSHRARIPDKLDGALLQARGSVFGDEVYLCRRGKRHWICSAERARSLGFHWPDDLVQVSESVLAAFRVGGHAPAIHLENANPADIRSSIDMREFMAARLCGGGLEVGAGSSPFPVPLHCQLLYGDKIPHDMLKKCMYPGQQAHNIVLPDLITDFEDFRGIANNSLDFIIGCHVIEHTRNPIGSIASAHQKLKEGGVFVLVVPDKERTFDKTRPLTTLGHLLEDYEQPNRQRDKMHYEEFYRLAFSTPEDRFEKTVAEQFACDGDLHYHVWDYQSFMKMLNYVQRHITAWSKVWSHPALQDPEKDIEFYLVLTK